MPWHLDGHTGVERDNTCCSEEHWLACLHSVSATHSCALRRSPAGGAGVNLNLKFKLHLGLVAAPSPAEHTHTRAHTHTRTTPPHVRHQCFLQPQLLLLGSATVWSSQNHLYHVFNDLTFTETFLCALLLHSAFHLTCRTMLRDGMTIINPLLQMTKLRPQRGQVICLRSHS